ncbi:hypothetical protein [Sphingomonas sp.]|uniref:hypothetical protein n=1 Tax=Sphingomonas sp. TaxID=28214 RepID=UPI0025E7953C|nr:hypothetical protein [Sphingomonas sp.]
MASDYNETASSWQDSVPPRRAPPMRSALVIALLAFLAGSVVMVWIFTRWAPARKLIGAAPVALVSSVARQSVVPVPPASIVPVPVGPANVVQAQSATVDMRVSQLEERIARIDLRAAAAAGNASRAEGLLIAFAARRAIDRGTGLGYVEGQLRDRFGETQPRAVSAVIAAGQQPVTIANLKQGLDRIAPNLSSGTRSESWWAATRRALSTLVIVRREGTPAPAPDERIARARLMLDGGQVDGALAEVARLPGQAMAGDWMTAARRWVEAHRALDIIEAAAIMPPPVVVPVTDVGVAPPATAALPTP